RKDLREAIPGHRVADATAQALARGKATADWRVRQDRWDVLQPLEAEHLLHQVGRDGQVRAPGRRGDLDLAGTLAVAQAGLADGAAHLAETTDRGAVRVDHARDLARAVGVHLDRRHARHLADHRAAVHDLATGDADQQRD